MTLGTQYYGRLNIVHNNTWLADEVIDTVMDCEDRFYEVRKTLNGVLVAYEVED